MAFIREDVHCVYSGRRENVKTVSYNRVNEVNDSSNERSECLTERMK